jgi:hypothetical protein
MVGAKAKRAVRIRIMLDFAAFGEATQPFDIQSQFCRRFILCEETRQQYRGYLVCRRRHLRNVGSERLRHPPFRQHFFPVFEKNGSLRSILRKLDRTPAKFVKQN